VKNSVINYSLQTTQQEEQKLYDHLFYCTQNETPEQLIHRFRDLFIRGTGYEDNNMRLALEKVVSSPYAEQEFQFVLNRCCHIIINRWQMQTDLKREIPTLIGLFEQILPPGSAHSRTSRKIRQLVQDFTKTEQCIKLKRLARLIGENQQITANKSQAVGNLIQRYPYLHQHCLLSEDSSYEFKQTVKKIQKKIQYNYELDLSQYVTHRVRLVETIRAYKDANKTKIPKRLIRSVKNPTLLSNNELDTAIKQYLGKVERGYSYRDLSQNFLSHTSQVSNYKSFKDDLYEYLILSIDSQYGKNQFNHKLYRYIQGILADYNSQKLNEFLIVRTYSQLFKFLVVDSRTNPDHHLFLDLIMNLGEPTVIGLLLKILLLYKKVKPYLEKRFSILFAHYESFTKDGVPWLIKSLENLQIAFSIHFGRADLSLVKII
jgi:hypothetical protein